MNQQFFEKIESLLPVLTEYTKKGRAAITLDQKVMLQDVYAVIYPGVRLDLSCDSCVVFALNMMLAFYEREHPKWLVTQTPTTATPDATPSTKPNKKTTTRKPKK